MKGRKRDRPQKRDPYAASLADPLYRQRRTRSGKEYRRSKSKKEAQREIDDEK